MTESHNAHLGRRKTAVLYIFGGLPGAGKSTLSRHLARRLRALHLRVDTIEHALKESGTPLEGPEGYNVAYRIAADNLRLGLPVIADTVNPVAITRRAWREVATEVNVPFTEIEVICSDQREHRSRVEQRSADIAGFRLPTWDDVIQRHYEPWDTQRILIDTARETPEQSLATLERALHLR